MMMSQSIWWSVNWHDCVWLWDILGKSFWM